MPKNFDFRISEAGKFSSQGRYNESLEIYSRLLEIYSDRYEIYQARSATYRAMGEIDRAINDLTMVISFVPNDASPYFRRARYKMILGKPEQAEKDFSIAISMDSGYFGESLRFYRAEARIRMGDFRSALEDCLSVNPQYSERHFFGHNIRSVSDMIAEINEFYPKG